MTVIDPAVGWRVNGSGSFAFGGTLAGVAGSLAHDLTGNTWTFTRTTSGAAVACLPGTAFTVNQSATRPERTLVVYTGRNNVSDNTLPVIDSLLTSAGDAQSTQVKRVLVLGTINGTNEPEGSTGFARVATSNARRAAMFGEFFLDVRADFRARGLTIVAIEPTSGDDAAIAQGRPPPSLMTDVIHPNADGYFVIAYLVADN